MSSAAAPVGTPPIEIVRPLAHALPVVLASPILKFSKPGVPVWSLAGCRQAMADVAARLAKDHPNLVFLPGEELIRRPDSLNTDMVHIPDHGAIEYADNLAPVLARALQSR